ncbi:condensation domain-containing protein, partial [Pseudomonas aeruginosa]|uniref:condensation domain-containing protein n=1 Tax=Pseudomonas aeruginosa TaxID=287 RepID=UPI001F1F25A3
VKLRGLRIELGEIEARLLEHPWVREAAVLAVDGRQLVGYVVLESEGGDWREALAAHLATSLPEYMVPAQWLALERMPLSPNGKLDRKALPAPEVSVAQAGYSAPRNAVERTLAEIWQDLLGVERVGLDDNFFSLGGDSIVSIQVVSRARQAGLQLSPRDLFQHQSIRSLALAAKAGAATAEQGPASGEVALAPVQRWFFERAIPNRQHWNQSLLLQARQPLDGDRLGRALERLQAQHDALRLRFREERGAWHQAYAEQAGEPLWRRQAGSEEALLALCEEAQRSLDLEQGPLLRALLVDMADGSQRLLLVIHHLAVDGVSWRILLEDLQRLYADLDADLGPRSSSYQAWSRHLHEQAGARLDELDYWQAQLHDAPHALPCENPHGALENRHERKLVLTLDAERTRQLLQEAPAAYRTQVNDLLLTALARATCRWSGDASVLVQLEGHGREDLGEAIDLSRTVGWFTSLFPLRLTPAADLGESLKAIKEQLRGVPDKGVGYGLLRYLAGEEAATRLAALPQPRITFNYLGRFDRQFDGAALLVPATESAGAAQDPCAPLANWLSIEGQVYGGELSLHWSFSREMFAEATVQRLVDDYARELHALIEHCCQEGNVGATPSDFPLATLRQEQLDRLPLARIEDIYPLSPMQHGMLFHSLYEQASGDYLNQLRVDVHGLDPARFRAAWQAALDSHDILRAGFKLDRRALPAPDASRLQQDYAAPRSELEQRLAAIWADVLKLGRVGLDDNFFELGGDSIISIQVVSRARQAGIRLAPRDLFLHQTIRGLAGVAVEGRGLASAEQGPISGSTPLLPIQQMFFELDIPRRQHWNQSVLLEPGQALDGTLLETALQALLAHHDALRLGFRLEDGTWCAEHRAVEAGEALLWQQSVADGQALEALAEQAQRSLDLGRGPLLRALLATLGDGSQRLLLVIHHLAVDGVSWRILLEDLQTAYRQLQAGQAVALPAKTSAFKAWAERLQAHARDGGLEGERGYWLAQLEGVSTELPCDDREGAQSVRHVRSARTELTEEATRRLLQEAPAAYRTQVNDLLLTALARVIGRWTGQADTLIQLEGHGREELFEDIDLTRTVGWFTSLFPLRLSPVAELGASIKRIKEQLRAIPHKGLGFGALRYLGSAEDRAALAALPSPRITFNYLGQFDGSFSADSSALFRPSADAAGSERDSDAPLDNWLSLNGQVYAGRLGIDWSFSAARFSEASILRLADAYRDELLALIEHCCAADVEGVTPSDFPLAGLDQRQLDALPLAAGEVEDLYPLSPMQQGMLFHSLYQQNSGDYINQMRLDVEGLDPQRFREAWQAALDAHEVLRSGFLWQGALEKPLQLVRKRVEVPFSVHDWRDRADLAEALDALAAGEAGLGFELAEAPLLRLVLVRTGERRHHLIYTNHHILMDGWSNSQLLGEVLQRYRGETPSRSDGRYRDYIAWLQRQDAGRTEAFWKQRLQRLGEPTLLVPAFAHGVRGAEGHADRYRQLDVTTSQRLAEFAREQKVTLNTLVQAAWLILLQRFTGQDTVAFGATVSGRPAELRGIEEQIGLFINTLPVVASPCPEQPLGDWLQAVQGENLALREFEHTPLYDIQRWAGQVGEALFDNILVFENYPVSAALAEETPTDMRIDALSNQEQTHYPLTLLVSAGETLELHYSYSRQAFDEAAIECLAERLERLLLGMCENPGASLGELDSLAAAERYQLLEGWNATAAEYPLQRGVHR